ncbi:Na(+)-translocating NADH-quinone reductase subunit A [Rhabdobacter roseus]|uniref:Na(+)-translocating NADH-quinone reductase subunit A n=1 Tax=Rhabdobacter roseus TaxID=1655419 RepID=A0A840TUL6_9BACT|nr:Na(+)-translocating NADH-quinone reductase subunit A [Rhabdobacter roseus]MBB5285357.1 Na+-transporting NADH:ubiquinone oxidoreductase subunit A [Rhabdobacter roseus]
MTKQISIRRGYDIKLVGSATSTLTDLPLSNIIAIRPPDFPLFFPKLLVETGDEVQAGSPLFFDRNHPNLRIPSPVSGEVTEIVRGEKRRIMEVRILPDQKETRYLTFLEKPTTNLDREKILDILIESGCWSYFRQRPFSIIANTADQPKAIFVSCFDSSPLAPDLAFVCSQEPESFKAGLEILRALCQNVHLGVRADDTSDVWTQLPEVHIHKISGPHPAGNVGIQIHHIDPIRKDDIVWYIHPQDLLIIGRLFREGRYRADRIVALTGSCVKQPQYYRLQTGQPLQDILNDQLTGEKCRIIQGNVLSGKKAVAEDFLSFNTNQLTVIPEGDEPEFLGWLLPGFKKLSLSRTFFSWLAKNRTYDLDTNLHGEERAFVLTGQYEKVLPMNIMPVVLLKAILAKDIEQMEQLGIYEVAEEDFALCEFICTSKIEVQRIISEGLELARTET